jgi:hypothetical protein
VSTSAARRGEGEEGGRKKRAGAEEEVRLRAQRTAEGMMCPDSRSEKLTWQTDDW